MEIRAKDSTMKTQTTPEKASPHNRRRRETRGRPRIYAAGRCQPRVALDAGEYLLFERAAKKHGKSVPYVIGLAARYGFKSACDRIAGIPKMEE